MDLTESEMSVEAGDADSNEALGLIPYWEFASVHMVFVSLLP